MGMLGADDPDNRKPLVWPDIDFENETQSEFSDYTYSEKPSFNQEMFDYYKSLIAMRKSSPVFTYGTYEMTELLENEKLLAYYRTLDNEKYLVVFNSNNEVSEVDLSKVTPKYELVFSYRCGEIEEKGHINMPAYSAFVVKINQ